MGRNYDKRSKKSTAQILQERFKKYPVANIVELSKSLKATTRTAIRALYAIGYLSSYSHAGKYYTLRTIPKFDTHGLWFYRDIGFSKQGTLRDAIIDMVKCSSTGYTHEELKALLRIRVHDTLRDLVDVGLIQRETVDGTYVYLTATQRAGKAQLVKRLARPASLQDEPTVAVDTATVIQILLAVINRARAHVNEIGATLRANGIKVTSEQIMGVLSHYGVPKKIGNGIAFLSKSSRNSGGK